MPTTRLPPRPARTPSCRATPSPTSTPTAPTKSTGPAKLRRGRAGKAAPAFFAETVAPCAGHALSEAGAEGRGPPRRRPTRRRPIGATSRCAACFSSRLTAWSAGLPAPTSSRTTCGGGGRMASSTTPSRPAGAASTTFASGRPGNGGLCGARRGHAGRGGRSCAVSGGRCDGIKSLPGCRATGLADPAGVSVGRGRLSIG